MAKTGEPPVPMGEGVEILARFGEVPDDDVLIPERERLPWPRRSSPLPQAAGSTACEIGELHETRGFADG